MDSSAARTHSRTLSERILIVTVRRGGVVKGVHAALVKTTCAPRRDAAYLLRRRDRVKGLGGSSDKEQKCQQQPRAAHGSLFSPAFPHHILYNIKERVVLAQSTWCVSARGARRSRRVCVLH